MAEFKESISWQIIDAVTKSIRNHDPFEEIRDMFVDTLSYRQVVQSWQDTSTGLNLLQLAIVCDYAAVVEFLSNNKYTFEYMELPSCSKVNRPLHLACKIGSEEIIRAIITETVGNEGDNALFYLLRDTGIVTYPKRPSNQSRLKSKTPFEICVEEGHVQCSLYLSKLIRKYISSSFTASPFYVYTEESTVLHDACFLGSAKFLHLLLEKGYVQDIHVRNQMGYQPLHVAAALHHADCMDLLLQYGADVNASAECKSALHLAYGYKANAEFLLDCTEVLLRHHISINTTDRNHNTALGYLAWEFGQRYTPNVFLRTHKYSLIHANYNHWRNVNNTEDYKREIYACMELLLKQGALAIVRSGDGHVDHTLVHTLLKNAGYPLSSCLSTHPQDVYKVLQLLFVYGADPNLVVKSNNESAFALLIVYTMKEITTVEMMCRFLHLFIINGSQLNHPIAEPKPYWESSTNHLWNMYPVLLALQVQHPMPVIRLMYSFMDMRTIYCSFRQMSTLYLWYRITSGVSLGSSMQTGAEYEQQWKQLKRELLKPRTLCHHCKLVVLRTLGFKGRQAEKLPLPNALIQYISNEY